MKRIFITLSFCMLLCISNAHAQVAGAPVVNINSGNPKFPFPQFLPYSNGQGHSIGNLGTNNAPGVTHAEMEKLIREAWQIFANEFTYSGESFGGVQYIKGNNGCPYDCSEGDGYALLAAAYMGDKTIFDGLWMRTHDLRMVMYPRYADCVVPRPGYKYGKNTLAEPGGDAAADGDFDIALALLMAWYQWGDLMGINDACGNPISYKNEALNVIKGLVEITNSNLGDCRSTSGNIGFDGYVKNGNTWLETTNWASNMDPCPEYKGPTPMHVDYMAPAYFRAFREFLTAQGVTGWDVDQLLRAEASSDWIVGEWIYKNQKNIPVGGWVDVTSGSPIWSTFMQGEDFRAPWRTILNYVWYGNPTYTWNPTTHQIIPNKPNTYEFDAAVRFSKYLNSPQSAPWNNPCVAFGGGPKLTYQGPATLQWEISPTGMGSSAFTLNWIPGCGSPAAVAAQDYDLMGQLYRQCAIEWDVTTPGDGYLTSKPVYFHGWFRLLGLLVTSGNAHSPTQMLPKANLKIYRAIKDKITYAFTGDEITYNFSYRNYGSVDALGTQIIENIPEDFAFVSATNGGVYNAANHTITWNIGTVKGFKTGQLAQTTGTVSYTARIKDNASGRYCTTATISCSNGFGDVTNDYPNNVSATMERNCVDVIARALKIEKTADRDKANPGNIVSFNINFENSSDAGWIDGGRPGVNVAYAHGAIASPESAQDFKLQIRLFHDAVEPYINYGNYRISYFVHDPSINCLAGTAGCGTGWTIANDVYEGGNANSVVLSHENIVPGSDAKGQWNQRLVVQFAPLLVTTTPHLSNYYGMGARIHQGGTQPLRAVWRIHANYTNLDWTNDWSWDKDATQDLSGNYFPITPDWTDIYNPNKPVTKWHPNACETATKTIDNILVEEFDGYVWRRILGNGPVPGRDISNVIIKDTLPKGLTFKEFTGSNPLGIPPTVTTIADGRQVISWMIPKLQVKQKGTIAFTATVAFPTATTCPGGADVDIINKAWISGDKESPIYDTAKITVTCKLLPTVIPPTSMKKTANKTTYSTGDPISYTITYTQNHGSIITANLNNTGDWTGSGWKPENGKLTSISNNSNKITYDYAYGKNIYMEAMVTPGESANFRVLFREGSAGAFALGIRKEWGAQLVFYYIVNNTVIEQKQFTYGGTLSPYSLKIDLQEDLLRVWINNDTTQSPIYTRTGVPIGVGHSGFANGLPADSYATHVISNLKYHVDVAYNLVITDPKPAQVTFVSASNSGTNNAGTITWNIPSGKGAGIPWGTVITRTWVGNVASCNDFIENVAYANIMGHASNSIAAQSIVQCGASCPNAPSVSTPITYCKGATAVPLSAGGTNLSWYTTQTGGSKLTAAPTPSTLNIGNTSYYVSQTANGCESYRAEIIVSVIETAMPTTITALQYCKGAIAPTLTATGTNISWYDVANGGTALANAPTPNTSTAGITKYYVTQTENTCESQRKEIEITIIETAKPTVTSTIEYCKNDIAAPLTANGTNLKWYTSEIGGSSQTVAPTPSTATAGETSYYVSQTDNSCESVREKITVHVYEVISPLLAGTVDICEGETISLYNQTELSNPNQYNHCSTLSYEWTGPQTINNNSSTLSIPNAKASDSGTYSLTIHCNGCSSTTETILVTVVPTPASPQLTTNSPICAEQTLSISDNCWTGMYPNTCYGTLPVTYQWTGPNGFTNTSHQISIPNAQLIDAGAYSVVAIIQNCPSIASTVDVQISAPPTTPSITSNSPVCEGKIIELSTPTIAGATYSWSGPNGFSSLDQNPIISQASNIHAGTYSLTIKIGDCISETAYTTIAIKPTPQITFEESGAFCIDSSPITLSVSTTPMSGTTTYSGNGVSGDVFSPAIAGIGSHTITAVHTLNGCSASATVQAIVQSKITVDFNLPTTACNSDAVISLIGNPSGGVFTSNPSIPLTGGFNPASATPNQEYIINYKYSDGVCSYNIEKPITVYAPVAPIGINASKVYTLITDQASIPELIANGTNVLWFSDAALLNEVGSGTNFQPLASDVISAGVGVPGIYTYYAVSKIGSCTSNATAVSLTITSCSVAAPTVLQSLVEICYGTTDNNAKTLSTTNTGDTYIWYFNNTVVQQNSDNTFIPTQTAVGTYQIEVSQFSISENCESPRTAITFRINPLPTVSFTPPSAVCMGSEVINFSTYTSQADGIVTCLANNSTCNEFNPSTAGTYLFEYSYINTTTGCANSVEAQILVRTLPTLSFSNPAAMCEYDNAISLLSLVNPSGGTFTGNGVSGSNFSPAISGVGSHELLYTFTDSYSCKNSVTAQAIVNSKPSVTFNTIPAICMYDDPVDLNIFVHPNGGLFTGTGVSGTLFTAPEANTFEIEYAIEENGCINSEKQSILVNPIPIVQVIAPTNICFNDSPVNIATTPTGVKLFFNGLELVTNTINPANYTAGASYPLTFSYQHPTTLCSTDKQSYQPWMISIEEVPTPIVIDKTVILGSTDVTITATSSGGTITWTDNIGTVLGTGTSISHHSTDNVGTWQYCVKETKGACTSNTACMNYTVTDCPTPTPIVTNPTVSICMGQTIPSFYTTPYGTATVQWYNNLLQPIHSGQSFTPSISALQTGEITYYVSQIDGCESAKIPVSITIHEIPEVSLTMNATLCKNSGTIEPSINPLGGKLTLNGTEITNINTNTLNAGLYSLLYEYTDSKNCSNSKTTQFELISIPKPIVNDKTTVLATADVSISAQGTGNLLTWEDELGNTIGTGNSITHNGLVEVGQWTYCVKETNGICSSELACMTYTIIDCPTPAPSINLAAKQICEGESLPTYFASGIGTINWYNASHVLIHTGTEFTPETSAITGATTQWYATAFDGCESPKTPISVTIHSKPIVDLQTNATECINTGIKTPITSPIGGTFTIQGVVESGINTNTLSAGFYNLSYEYTNPTTNCVNSVSNTLEIIEIAKPIVGNKTTLISNPDLQLTALALSGGTLTWYDSNHNLLTTGEQLTFPHTPNIGSWDFCVVETKGACSSEPACMTYAIIDCPVAAPTTLTPVIQSCLHETMPSIQVQGTETIRWYNKNNTALIIHTGNSFTPSISQKGTYEYYVTQYDGTCEGIGINIQLIVSETPTPIITGSKAICEQQSVTLQTNTNTGTIHWYTSNPETSSAIATAATYSYIGLSPGIHTIWAIHETNCKSLAASTTITVHAIPESPSIEASNVCSGETILFSSPNTSVKWYSSANATSPLATGNSYSIAQANGSTQTIFATQTSNTCESQKSSKTIIIHPIPASLQSQSFSICEYEPTPVFTTNAEMFAQVSWYSTPQLTNVIATGNSFTPSTKTTQTVYAVQTVAGCTSKTPASFILTVKPQPSPVNFKQTNDVQVCVGEEIAIGTVEALQIKWYDSELTNAPVITVGPYFTVLKQTPETITVYATQTVQGCESEKRGKTIHVIAGPSLAQIDKEATICQGDTPGTLRVIPQSPSETISWINAKGEIVGFGSEFTVPETETPNPNVYTFIARTTVSGCSYQAKKEVALKYEVLPTPIAPKLKQESFCFDNKDITLSSKGSSILWYDAEKQIIPQCSNKEYCNVTSLTPGTHNFFISQSSKDCISEIAPISIYVSEIPNPEIAGKQYICANTSETYYIAKFDASNTIQWTVSGNRTWYDVANTQSGFARTIDWIEPGLDTIFVMEKNSIGCIGTAMLPIYVTPIPDADFIVEQPGEEGIVLIHNTSIPQSLQEGDSIVDFKVDYYWDFNRKTDKGSAIINTSPIRNSYDYGKYTITLTAINEAGCMNSTSEKIFVDMKYALHVPTAFSPTNPAHGVRNFYCRGFNLTEFQIWIFDSWGNLIWYSEGVDENGSPQGTWDGTYDGKLLQSGTYMWKIHAKFVDGTVWKGSTNNSNKLSQFGNVLLIR